MNQNLHACIIGSAEIRKLIHKIHLFTFDRWEMMETGEIAIAEWHIADNYNIIQFDLQTTKIHTAVI